MLFGPRINELINQYFIFMSLNIYLNDTLTEKTSAPDNVLRKEFPDDDCDVGTVDFVDQTIDGLLESFPSQSLVSFTVLVCDVLLHHPQLGWRDVSSSSLGR